MEIMKENIRRKKYEDYKIVKYSIQKLSLGVAPIVMGTFGNYVPGNVTKAGEINFKYVDEKELNEIKKTADSRGKIEIKF